MSSLTERRGGRRARWQAGWPRCAAPVLALCLLGAPAGAAGLPTPTDPGGPAVDPGAGDRAAAPVDAGPAAAATFDPFDEADFDDFGEDLEEPDRDPLEPFNRVSFAVNEGVDLLVLDPVASAYDWLLPEAVEEAIRNVFENLEEPVTVVNDLLQLQPRDAARSFGRFALNTTVGLGGLFDPAHRLGLEAHDTDFGETLGAWGVPSGPYLVIPLLGPTTVRDAVGGAVDTLFQPHTYAPLGAQLAVRTGDGLTEYELHAPMLEALRQSSVDYYTALRSAYLQARDREIAEARRRFRGESGSTRVAVIEY